MTTLTVTNPSGRPHDVVIVLSNGFVSNIAPAGGTISLNISDRSEIAEITRQVARAPWLLLEVSAP